MKTISGRLAADGVAYSVSKNISLSLVNLSLKDVMVSIDFGDGPNEHTAYSPASLYASDSFNGHLSMV